MLDAYARAAEQPARLPLRHVGAHLVAELERAMRERPERAKG